MNETLKTIAERYSCRNFKDEMPAHDLLEAIVNAAIQSPSARNIQPWRVVLVKDRNLIKEMEMEGMYHLSRMEDMTFYDNVIKRGGALFYNAPAMIVIPVDLKGGNYPLVDCGILCQTIALAATSLGLGNVICGLTRLAFIGPEKSTEFKTRLGFPDGYEFGCSVLLGYPKSTKEPHVPDKDKIIYVE